MLNKEVLEKDFMLLVKEGKEAISLISDADKKALACAQLAQAIASTGVLNIMELKAATGILSADKADKIEAIVKESFKEEIADKKEKKTTKSSKSTKSKTKGKDALKNEASKEPAKKEEEVPAVEEVPAIEETPQEKVESVEAETVKSEEEEIPAIDESTTVDAEIVEEQADVELVDEWTDEMCELKAADLEAYNWYLQEWGEDKMCDLVSSFFEGRESDLSAIRPTNITGFVTFLYETYMEENPEG